MLIKPTLQDIEALGGSYRQHPRYARCIGHWMFVEGGGSTLHDFAGKNHGAITGATWKTGKYGYLLDFDGNQQWVNCGVDNIFNFTSGTFTLSAWIKTAANTRAILSRIPNGPFNGWEWGVGIGISQKLNFWNGSSWKGGNTNLNDGKLHHVVTVFDGSNDIFYVDGVKDATVAHTSPSNQTTQELYIGIRDEGPGDWEGTLDEIRIYRRALSEVEIRSLFRNPFEEFRPTPIIIGTEAGVAVNPNDLDSASTLDEPGITQKHIVSPDDLNSASTLDEPGVSQKHIIAPDSIDSASIHDEPTITQKHIIAPDDITSDSILDQPAIVENQTVSPNDIDSASTLDEPGITQKHIVSPNDLTSASVLDSPSISVAGAIVPDSLESASILDQPAIIQKHIVSPDDLTSDSLLDEPVVSLAETVSPDSIDSASVIDEPAITQKHVVAPDEILSDSLVESPTVLTGIIVNPDEVFSQSILQSPTITQKHIISPNGLVSNSTLDEPLVGEAVSEITELFLTAKQGAVIASAKQGKVVVSTTD